MTDVGAPAATSWQRTLACILGVAMILRVCALLVFPGLHHPDEVFQILEQAHRLAFGYGITPWEFQDGIRSMVIPIALSKIWAVTEPIVGGPQGFIILARLLVAALSLTTVVAIYRMGLRTSPTHGLLAGVVAATWFEIVYFSFRYATEAIAFNFLVIALCLASVPTRDLTARRLMLIGFCAALACMLRIHLGAGVAVLVFSVCGRQIRQRWLPLIVGALPPLLLFGAVDWATWGVPFGSFIETIKVNLIAEKASDFGTKPVGFILGQVYSRWSAALPFLIGLIAWRARDSKLWLAVALAILVSHSLIPHKEYRFFFPALGCLVLIAAMATADLVQRGRALGLKHARLLAPLAVTLWVAVSATLAFGQGYIREWYRSGELMKIEWWLAEQPDLCGVLMYDYHWTQTGGYTYLHRNVPLYELGLDAEKARRDTAGYNYVMLNRSSIPDFSADFSTAYCVGNGKIDDACVIRRAGACTAVPDVKPMAEHLRAGDPAYEKSLAEPRLRHRARPQREAGFWTP